MLDVAVSSQVVANEFLRLARSEERNLTNMQVQKLVFLAQGYCLALLDRPMYYHNTHAWQWGPVVPKLYKDLRKYGSGIVMENVPSPSDESIDPDSREHEVLTGVWKAYGNYTGGQLSALTHREGTPWFKTWMENKFGVIQLEDIQEYYHRLVHRVDQN